VHLINVLASGVAGAENGSATIYRRGTATHATTYQSFYGTSANTPGVMTLDVNGGATVYVNELVDVTVRDSDGATVRSFTAGDEATAVQYAGTSFTGVNPVTGASAVSQPVSVKTALDTFRSSFGAPDAQVSFAGSNRDLSDVLTGLNCFFNVKDPLYGAVGDGSTDDTAAIQAAITAANAAGGGIVFIPEGTYKTSSSIALTQVVSLLGAGSTQTIIAQSHASNATMSTTTASVKSGQRHFISGIYFKATVANTGVVLTSNTNIVISSCHFGDGTNSQGTLLILNDGTAPNYATVVDCGFSLGTTGQLAIDNSGAYQFIERCVFSTPATYTGYVVEGYYSTISNCRFVTSTTTSGTVSCIGVYECIASGNDFGASGGATVYAFNYTGSWLRETGSVFGTSVTAYYGINNNSYLQSMVLGSRDSRNGTDTSNTTPETVDADQYGSFLFATDGGAVGARTISMTPGPLGSKFFLTISNGSGNSHNFSFVTTISGGTTYSTGPAYTIADAYYRGFVFQSVLIATKVVWQIVGVSEAYQIAVV
jgi:hypothetical protein